MIDELSVNKLTFQGNFLLVTASQRQEVDAILKENGYIGEWSPSVSSIQPYSDFNDDFGEVAVWTVFIGKDINISKIQSVLDEVK